MRLRGKYNIGVLFLVCLAVSMLLPVSVACNKKDPDQNLHLNRVAALTLTSGGQPGFIDRYINSKCLKKSGKSARTCFGKVVCVRRMIPEEDRVTKIILLSNAVNFPKHNLTIYNCWSWFILPVSARPQDFLLAYSRRSPPSV